MPGKPLPATESEQLELVQAALLRMMNESKDKLPFLVVECEQTRVFVQFRGSLAEDLLLDVPILGSQRSFGRSPEDLQKAARAGLQTLGVLQRWARRQRKLEAAGVLLLEEHPEPAVH